MYELLICKTQAFCIWQED